VRTDKLRADTTVVEANVAYPTDSGLLAKGVARLGVLAGRVKGAGLAKRTRFRDRARSVRRRAHDVAVWLRRRSEDAKDEVVAITGESRPGDARRSSRPFVGESLRSVAQFGHD
jgi:IS5 family transposase